MLQQDRIVREIRTIDRISGSLIGDLICRSHRIVLVVLNPAHCTNFASSRTIEEFILKIGDSDSVSESCGKMQFVRPGPAGGAQTSPARHSGAGPGPWHMEAGQEPIAGRGDRSWQAQRLGWQRSHAGLAWERRWLRGKKGRHGRPAPVAGTFRFWALNPLPPSGSSFPGPQLVHPSPGSDPPRPSRPWPAVSPTAIAAVTRRDPTPSLP